MSVNKAILVGNVGIDPEIRYIEGGTPVANIRLATSENYTNKSGEKVSQTEWHNVVLWRGLAEIVEKYVKKGSQIYIEGRIRTRSWEDRDGNKRYTTEIVADTMQLLGRRDENRSVDPGPMNEPDQSAPQSNDSSAAEADGADDLPF